MKPIPLSNAELQIVKDETTDLIILDLEGKTKEDVLLNIAKFVKEKGLIKDERIVYQKFLDREMSGTTAIGAGVALPEACWIEMARPYSFILCRAKEDIDFNSVDKKPVRIILASLGGDKEDLTRMKHITRLVKALKSVHFRTMFLKAKIAEDVYSALCGEGIGMNQLRKIYTSREKEKIKNGQ